MDKSMDTLFILLNWRGHRWYPYGLIGTVLR